MGIFCNKTNMSNLKKAESKKPSTKVKTPISKKKI